MLLHMGLPHSPALGPSQASLGAAPASRLPHLRLLSTISPWALPTAREVATPGRRLARGQPSCAAPSDLPGLHACCPHSW